MRSMHFVLICSPSTESWHKTPCWIRLRCPKLPCRIGTASGTCGRATKPGRTDLGSARARLAVARRPLVERGGLGQRGVVKNGRSGVAHLAHQAPDLTGLFVVAIRATAVELD